MLKRAKTLGLAIAVMLSGAVMAHGAARQSAKQHGYEHGYRDGYQHGRVDRMHGISHDFHSEDFRLADRGYEPWMGEHDDFQHGYRDGYRSGYDDAFYGRTGRWDRIYGVGPSYDPYARRDGNYDGDADDRVYAAPRSDYHDTAYDFGYRDGVAMGEKDHLKGKAFRPEKNEWFEDADHGYHKEFGPKRAYQQQYRDGFVRGYEDGFGRWR